MNFKMHEAIDILERTPDTLTCFLSGMSEGWLQCDEGEDTWNASQVVEHLIEAERHNWLPRLEHILQEGELEPFPAFDRFSHLDAPSGRAVEQSLAVFAELRKSNMAKLSVLVCSDEQLERTGSHPAFGVVKIKELIATWTVHDLTHIAQIVRVMANRYREDVGPWVQYLGILRR